MLYSIPPTAVGGSFQILYSIPPTAMGGFSDLLFNPTHGSGWFFSDPFYQSSIIETQIPPTAVGG
jgi:hypothetical protein